MKIALTNLTHWQDAHIKAFILQAAREERPDLCKRGAPALRVRVVYTRRNGSSYSSGHAYLHSNTMCVRLSKHTPDKIDFAHTVAHELAHTRGVGHAAMRGTAQYRRVGSYRTIYAWAEQLPLEVKPKKVTKVTPDAKLAHAQKMLKAALTREKRATTLRKKWEAKLKYYSKKAAAMTA